MSLRKALRSAGCLHKNIYEEKQDLTRRQRLKLMNIFRANAECTVQRKFYSSQKCKCISRVFTSLPCLGRGSCFRIKFSFVKRRIVNTFLHNNSSVYWPREQVSMHANRDCIKWPISGMRQ